MPSAPNADIRCVLIVGAGTMGQQIGLQCAMHGYEVLVYDIAPDALEAARAQINAYAAQLVDRMRLAPSESSAALARIRFTANPADADRADLVSESVPEDPALKAKVFAQLNKICPSHTIFTTNSSSLVPSMFAAATGRPAQFAALHFHSVVWDITQYWATATGDAQLQANANFLKQYVDKNWLGVKTGRGFYTYPDPAYARPGFLTVEAATAFTNSS